MVGEGEVMGRDRHPVTPEDVVAHMKDVAPPPVTNLPAIGDIRHDLALGSEVHQPAEELCCNRCTQALAAH